MADDRDHRRRFTAWQVRQKVIACGGKCEKCGGDLGDGFHMHHKKRHADGGQTILVNCQALCVACHRGVHSEIA
jgi:5-methylcytosine-specific restriction endonuclease McrA